MNNRPNTIAIFREQGTANRGGWHWRRIAPNGRKQYTSGEPYYNRSGARRAAVTHAHELNVPVVVVIEHANGQWTRVPL